MISTLRLDIGSISAALSCLVYPPRVRGRSAGSFPEQRLVIEPNIRDDLDEAFCILRGRWFNAGAVGTKKDAVLYTIVTPAPANKNILGLTNGFSLCPILHLPFNVNSFSSPEPTILLACGRNRELLQKPFRACAIDEG